MPHLPRRGPGRHGQPGAVAMHPGWTLTPTAVTDAPVHNPDHVRETAVPVSRWTSTQPLPHQPEPTAQAAPAEVTVEAPVAERSVAEPVAPEDVAPELVVAVPVAVPAADPGWITEWEAVAATPPTPSGPMALHTAAVAAIDAVFGRSAAPVARPAAPASVEPLPVVVQPVAAVTPIPGLSALDQPLPPTAYEAATPLAYEAARAAVPPAAVPAPVPTPVLMPAPPVPAVLLPPPPVAVPAVVRLAPPTIAPPTTPPPRATSVPSSAQQLLERAIRTAPSAAAQRRSTVRLGFTDASVIDLRPDDPIAKALHTVADALIGRERR